MVSAGFDLPTHGNNRWIYHQVALICWSQERIL